MNILIIGGVGIIDSAVILHIIRDAQDSVVNLDKLAYAGSLKSLAEVSGSERYAFELVDICDRAEVEGVLREHRPVAVMYLAAESHFDRSVDGVAAFVETNIVALDGGGLGINLSYVVQPSPTGLAQAFILGEDFISQSSVCLVLGDNIFYGQYFSPMVCVSFARDKRATLFGY